MIGTSPAFQRMRNAARLVAATDAGVLLLGEPGSGRATLAREIHALSPRASSPFRVLQCVGGPDRARLEALCATAPGAGVATGTLYLNEVGELPLSEQGRLLQLIESADQGRGGATPRVIAASALDLDAAVRDGRFRRDLYLRLCVVPIEVPPLRERVLDLPPLTAHFLAAAAARHGGPAGRLKSSAARLFRRYDWPGNLRELANLCERLVILLPGRDLGPEHLPRELVSGISAPPAEPGFALPPRGIDLPGLERDLLRQALVLADGNQTRAARLLGLTRDTFLYRARKHLGLA